MSLTFGLPAFLWALPLALLPILLHIRARARERTVDFPGAFFLQDPALPSAERRRRVEDLLLLVLRSLMLAVAIMALARPNLKGGGWLGASDPSEVGREAAVLVVDDSPSLTQRTGSAGTPLFPVWLEGLAGVLAEQSRRRVAVETASGRSMPFVSAEELASRLESVFDGVWAASGDRPRALQRALGRFAHIAEDRRVVILLTDWRPNSAEGAEEEWADRWTSASQLFERPGAPALITVDLGAPLRSQWSVEQFEPVLPFHAGLGPGMPVAGQPFALRVKVRCHAGPGARTLRIESANVLPETPGRALAHAEVRNVLERYVVLEAGASAEVMLPGLAMAPGIVWYRASFEKPDEWPFDDAAELVVRAESRREVVLWDLRGEPGAPASLADSARRTLVAALDPLAVNEASRVRLLQPPFPRVDELPPGALIVALHDLKRASASLSERMGQGAAERLRGRLLEGLHILWIPDFTSADEFRTRYPGTESLADDPLLPRGIERFEVAEEKGSGWRLGLSDFGHPLLAPFADGRNGDLGGVSISHRLRLAVEPAFGVDLAQREGEQVLARFRDGFPALVFQRVGEGSLGQLAFGPQPRGGISESAAWPVLLQTYVEWVAMDGLGPHPGLQETAEEPGTGWPLTPAHHLRRLLIDGPHFLPAGGGALDSAKAAAFSKWVLTVPPRAEQVTLPVFQRTGLYRIGLESTRPASEFPSQRWVNCRVAPEESSHERLPGALWLSLSETARNSGGSAISCVTSRPLGADPVADWTPLREALERMQPGRSLARWLWTFFAVAMALELTLLILRRRVG